MKLSGHTSEVHRTYTHHEMAKLHSAVINAGIDADADTGRGQNASLIRGPKPWDDPFLKAAL
jgi:hypothetical protein